MTDAALRAFKDVDFNWVRPLESVWSDAGATDSRLNADVVEDIVDDFLRATKDAARKPPGRIVIGEAGSGKTHLVGNLRHEVWARGGWFILLDVVGITDFWKSAALSFLTSLLQVMGDGRRQSDAVLAGVARRLGVETQVEAAFAIPTVDAKLIVDLLVPGLAKIDFPNTQAHQDVFRALALMRSNDFAAVGVAHAWLQGYEADETARRALGLTKPPPTPVDLVKGMSWVMSLAGPTLIAVDQIDGVIASGAVSVANDGLGETMNFGDVLAAGLLQLFDAATRSQVVMSCLDASWNSLRAGGLKSAIHRFDDDPVVLAAMGDEAMIGDLIAHRLAPAYAAAAFRPAYPTWPFAPGAIKAVRGLTPRTILMECETFRRSCLRNRDIRPCESLPADDAVPAPPITHGFDGDYAKARAQAEVAGLLDPRDDGPLGRVLREAFELYAMQIEPRETIDVVAKGDAAQRMPPLHGRLAFTYHDEADRERHVCFRAIQHENAVAFQARLRAALTASGIAAKIPDRDLLIVRRAPIPSGAKTKALVEAFVAAGGKLVDPTDDDFRSFVALVALRDAATTGNELAAFEAWLRARCPLGETAFFKSAGLWPPPLPDTQAREPAAPPVPSPHGEEGRRPVSNHEALNDLGGPAMEEPGALVVRDGLRPPYHEGIEDAGQPATPDILPLGHRVSAEAEPVFLPTKVLPRHTAIIAGAGSGKTVLLRRMVEEAALAGIPAIVIDPNNDLARLGDAWPEPPAAFTPEDAEKAKRYAQTVEVVIWTPGIHAGNPLFLSVLPDFAAIGDDPDERGQAVTMAADTLGPLAGVKTNLARGVLSDALRAFAAKGGGALKDMIALLADLPDGVSEIDDAAKLAAKMANELKAAIATNPLLKVTGAVLDPALLFRAKAPGKTRLSVVNLSGLASDEAKQDFVNRLQMTLFGWIKKHPSPKGMLYVIDEAQNFVPSGAGALSKTSGVQLVAQARKYGLGMIVVTQAPKGIDNKVVSNCTTQFLGKQNSPTDQATVKEMVAATGGRADDIGRLKMGEFYFKTEASGKPVKIATPICLSYHPANPPTPEAVVARAKATREDRADG